jgi:single-strand DNA-binding protein
MSRGLNKVMLIGYLGNDPETRQTTNNAVCNFSVATSESYKDSNGEVVERTEWHRVVAWGKLADICSQYLKKGRQVYIDGKLQTRSWEKDGQKMYTTEIIASSMQMLGSSGGGSSEHQNKAGDPVTSEAKTYDEKDDLPF